MPDRSPHRCQWQAVLPPTAIEHRRLLERIAAEIPLVLQLELESMAYGLTGRELSHADRPPYPGQARTAVRPEGTLTEDVGDVWKVLRAAIGVVAPARQEGSTRGTAVSLPTRKPHSSRYGFDNQTRSSRAGDS